MSKKKEVKNKEKMFINLAELFQGYRYKKNDKSNPDMWVPVKERSTHKYALKFKEWKEIVTTYLTFMFEDLTTGVEVALPKRLGYIQFVKKKDNTKWINHKKTRELYHDGKIEKGEFVYEEKRALGGYFPSLKWRKHKLNDYRTFKNASRYKMTLSVWTWRNYRHWLKEDITRIFYLNDK